jgi:regulator of sigma E protease
MVVAAGPFTNFIFSILAFALIALVVGRDIPRIDTIVAGGAAEQAGLQVGDIVRSVDGRSIKDFPDMAAAIATAPGRTLSIVVDRGGHDVSLQITPRPKPDQPHVGAIGVSHTSSYESFQRIGPLTALKEGATRTWQMVAQTFGYVAGVFTGRESGNQIAGPLGIVNVSGQVATAALDAPNSTPLQKLRFLGLSLLNLAAVLSVAVGIVNLLPIPILDGGHLLFYLIEGLRGGKPLPAVAQEWAYRAGFAVMASLFLFATWNDITRLLPGAQ